MFRHEPLWLMIGEFAIVRRGNRMGFQTKMLNHFIVLWTRSRRWHPVFSAWNVWKQLLIRPQTKRGKMTWPTSRMRLRSIWAAGTPPSRCAIGAQQGWGFQCWGLGSTLLGCLIAHGTRMTSRKNLMTSSTGFKKHADQLQTIDFLDVRTENLGPYLLLEMVNLVFDGGVE